LIIIKKSIADMTDLTKK